MLARLYGVHRRLSSFDNVDSDKRLDSGILASVVTQPNRAFRILGVSEEMFYENRATIIYTGSNVEVTPELGETYDRYYDFMIPVLLKRIAK